MKFGHYAIEDCEEALRELKSSEKGLSEEEAIKRLKIYGLNEIKEKKIGLLEIFFRQFKSPFFYLLFIAAFVAFFVGEKIDALIIFLFIFVNITLGFFQESKAAKTASLLKNYIPLEVRVRRSGVEKIINKKFLVPGDIVLLEAGNLIPADLRLIKINNFSVDESALSGESLPVLKIIHPLLKETKEIFEAKNIAFGATGVVSGEAEGLVIQTGKEAIFGELAKLSSTAKESAYEKSIVSFSKKILEIVVTTILFIFLANLLTKGTVRMFDFLIFSIALIVSILPEALPLVITFAFSEGSLKLAKHKIIVKRLSAIEDLGNIEILCSDKTGTLTENKLRVEKVFSPNEKKCLLYGLLSSSHFKAEAKENKDPFDFAIFQKASNKVRHDIKKYKQILEIPFDPFKLRAGALVEGSGTYILISKGAPETILKLSSEFENGSDAEKIRKEIEEEGKNGKRVLAIAYKILKKPIFSQKEESKMTFLGYFSFADPLKNTAKETIMLAQKMNLAIKILTGDSKEVAGYISKEIGLIKNADEVITGKELEKLSEDNFEKTCQDLFVFARVSPEMKCRIIQALQKKNNVGFLGDGINDVPALRASNVAISIKDAADAPREASDIILLKRDLKVIVDGIKEGRNVFCNINKYIKCALASNFGNFYSIAVISLIIPFLPMLPVQILLGNLLSDFPLISITTDKVDSEELQRPKLYQLSNVMPLVISLALVSTIFDFIFFSIFRNVEPAIMQTLWFIESILTEIMLIYAIRTRHVFFKTTRPSIPLLLLTIFDAVLIVGLPFTKLGQEFFHFSSLPVLFIFIVISLVISYFFISEIVKLTYFKYWYKNI